MSEKQITIPWEKIISFEVDQSACPKIPCSHKSRLTVMMDGKKVVVSPMINGRQIMELYRRQSRKIPEHFLSYQAALDLLRPITVALNPK